MIENILKKIYCLIEDYINPKRVLWDFQPILENQVVKSKYTVMFKNIGSSNATVNGFPLDAGDPSITLPTDRDEEDTTSYKIKFTGGSGTIWMIRKTLSPKK